MVLASFASSAGFLPTCSNRPSSVLRVGSGLAGSSRGRPERSPVSCPASRAVRSRASSLPGVHSLSRACACSTLIGLASRDQQLEGLAGRDVLAQALEPLGLAQPLEQLLRRRAVALGARRERLEQLLVGRLDLLGLDDRGEHRLALERAGRLGLGLVGERLLVLAGDLQVGLLGDALARERGHRLLEQLVGARVDELVGHLDLGLGDGGVEHRLLELALDRALLGLAQPRGDVLAQLGERVEAAGLGRELVVELGQPLLLDLVDGDLECRLLAGELGAG